MARDPAATRGALMDAAEALVHEHGFAATSLDAVIQRAGVTKGAFFHHFKSKADLGLAMVLRVEERYAGVLERNLRTAEKLSRDPVQQVLLFAALFEEEFAQLDPPLPGCLIATYCFEAGQFDEATLATVRKSFDRWRKRLGAKLEEAMKQRPPALPVSARELADMANATFEGGLVMSRGLGDPKVLIEQLRQYRNYLELLFNAIPGNQGPQAN